MDHSKRAHDLCLCLKVVLLRECENFETLFHHAKDLLDHVPELCMPVIEELLVVLGPKGDRSERA